MNINDLKKYTIGESKQYFQNPILYATATMKNDFGLIFDLALDKNGHIVDILLYHVITSKKSYAEPTNRFLLTDIFKMRLEVVEPGKKYFLSCFPFPKRFMLLKVKDTYFSFYKFLKFEKYMLTKQAVISGNVYHNELNITIFGEYRKNKNSVPIKKEETFEMGDKLISDLMNLSTQKQK